jgi:hypothetical protein
MRSARDDTQRGFQAAEQAQQMAERNDVHPRHFAVGGLVIAALIDAPAM